MMMCPRNIDEELFGDRVGDGLVVGEDGAIECRRREAACEAENGQQADQAAEPPGRESCRALDQIGVGRSSAGVLPYLFTGA
jgi:hypothetical protein